MIVKSVAYRNFRNLSDVTFLPDPGVNVLHGKNAQGKTNVLEGVYLFAQGRSFRTPHESDLTRFGETEAGLSLAYVSEKNPEKIRTVEIRWSLTLKKRSLRVDGVPVYRMSEMIGSFRAVLFCPQHLSLVNDGPAVRRNFLDVALSQLEPRYLSSLQHYRKLLDQRNARLRQLKMQAGPFPKTDDTAEIISSQMAKEAAFLAGKRYEYTEKLSTECAAFFSDLTGVGGITGKEVPSLRYRTPKTEEEYRRMLTDNLENEIRTGVTLYGIQKDDVEIRLNSHDARTFASQGQQRSLALALKFGEGALSARISGEQPVYLLDDILSELDGARRDYLLSGIRGKQVILTSCDPLPIDCRRIEVVNGTLIPVGRR